MVKVQSPYSILCLPSNLLIPLLDLPLFQNTTHEYGRKVVAIEVKSTRNPGYGDTTGLRAFLEEHPSASAGLLVHSGRNIKRLSEKILAVPWTMITG